MPELSEPVLVRVHDLVAAAIRPDPRTLMTELEAELARIRQASDAGPTAEREQALFLVAYLIDARLYGERVYDPSDPRVPAT